MSLGTKQKQTVLWIILPAALVYVGMKFYAQYRHIDVYVVRRAPMPSELSNSLHMTEHGIDPIAIIESPYATAENKFLSMAEVRNLQSQLAWRTALPPLVDSLTIQSPSRVLARRTNKRSMTEYQLVKTDGVWTIQSATRNQIQNHLPD